jgi:hypothetical protein
MSRRLRDAGMRTRPARRGAYTGDDRGEAARWAVEVRGGELLGTLVVRGWLVRPAISAFLRSPH